MKIYIYFVIISRPFFLRMRNVPDNSCREYQNTHFVFSDDFRKSCRLRENVDFFDEERKKFLRLKLTSKFNRISPVVFYLLLTSEYWD